jgi:hypothetical protein
MNSNGKSDDDLQNVLDALPPEERPWWKGIKRLSEASEEETRVMTDAEVYYAAVDIVVQKLQSDGNEILQVSTTLGSEPAIWFKVNNELKYIAITFGRYPAQAQPPEHVSDILQQFKDQNAEGFWVGVGFAHELEPFDPNWDGGMELMIGFGLMPSIGKPVPLGRLCE